MEKVRKKKEKVPMKIMLDNSQQGLIKSGSIITIENINYYFLPYYFQETGDSKLFEMHMLGHLPERLKEVLNNKRRGRKYGKKSKKNRQQNSTSIS